MALGTLRLFQRLEGSERVLLAGAGGGYDVFCGLPLYFHLKSLGKHVVLANLTFSNLYGATGRQLTPHVIEIDANSGGSTQYFPEKYLAEWFAGEGEPVSIHCFHRTGVAPLAEAYEALVAEYAIDAVVLVDGGTDSLMRGDEAGLGTPQEDIASIAAVDQIDVPSKILTCVGFGVDAYHGVCHAQFLEGVADLIRRGAFLGTFSLLPDMDEFRKYKEASDFVFSKMPHHPSIVSSSIVSAVDGKYGDYHATLRTRGSTLWINPLMGIVWSFDVEGVARRCLYLDKVRKTASYAELGRAIQQFRLTCPDIRKWEPIPH